MGAFGWILAIGLLIYVVYSQGKAQEDRDRKIDEMRDQLDDVQRKLDEAFAAKRPEEPRLLDRD